MPKSKC